MGPSDWELLITVLRKGLAVEESLKEEEEGTEEDGDEEEQDGEDEEDGILMYGNEVAADIFLFHSLFLQSFCFCSSFLG